MDNSVSERHRSVSPATQAKNLRTQLLQSRDQHDNKNDGGRNLNDSDNRSSDGSPLLYTSYRRRGSAESKDRVKDDSTNMEKNRIRDRDRNRNGSRSRSGSRSPRYGRSQERDGSQRERDRSYSADRRRSSSSERRGDMQSMDIRGREADDNWNKNSYGGTSRSKSPFQDNRYSRGRGRGRSMSRDRNGTVYDDDGPRQRQRAWGSRSRSRSPERRRNAYHHREQSRSPYSGRLGNTRRPSPTYDSYRPPGQGRGSRYEDNSEQPHDNPNTGRRSNKQQASGGRYDSEDDEKDFRRPRHESGSRGENPRNYQRTNDQPYARGRRPQEQMSHYSDSRREQRLAIKFSIWAPSPTEEELRNRSPSPDRELKKKSASKSRSKKHDLDRDSDSDDNDRRRRHKSSRSGKHRRSSSSRRKSGRRSRKRLRAASPSSENDNERQHSRKRKHHNSVGSRTPSPPRRRARRSTSQELMESNDRSLSETPRPSVGLGDTETEYPDDMWVEKKVEMPDDDQAVGPVPLQRNDGRMNERSYGGALLAGEGSAMAAYVQEGKRIPRRGEIGLGSDQIENYEHAGFVMSGSRHQRMNAVRVRKENQVISAEEKRALMLFNQEEKIKKDNKIINEMREMVASKLRSTGHSV